MLQDALARLLNVRRPDEAGERQAVQEALDLTPVMPVAQFGNRALGTGSVQTAMLADGAVTLAKIAAGAKSKIGTYTGDGNATQAITGLGFTPTLVLIFTCGSTDGAATKRIWAIKHAAGSQASTISLPTPRGTSCLTLDADGFTVNNTTVADSAATSTGNANINTAVYLYLAFG